MEDISKEVSLVDKIFIIILAIMVSGVVWYNRSVMNKSVDPMQEKCSQYGWRMEGAPAECWDWLYPKNNE